MFKQSTTGYSLYDPKDLTIYAVWCPEVIPISICWKCFKKTVILMTWCHSIEDENIVTYVDFDFSPNFQPKTVNWIGKVLKKFGKSQKCVPSNDKLNCFDDDQQISNIFADPYKIKDIQQRLHHSTTFLIGILWPIVLLKYQLINLKQTYDRYCFHYDRWTAERADCVSKLHSFKSKYTSDEYVNQKIF